MNGKAMYSIECVLVMYYIVLIVKWNETIDGISNYINQ
jgi:hypothetical protein